VAGTGSRVAQLPDQSDRSPPRRLSILLTSRKRDHDKKAVAIVNAKTWHSRAADCVG